MHKEKHAQLGGAKVAPRCVAPIGVHASREVPTIGAIFPFSTGDLMRPTQPVFASYVLVAHALLAGCSGSNAAADGGSDSGGSDAAASCDDLQPTGATDLVVSEINPGDYVELFNPTSADITLNATTNYKLCNFPSYTQSLAGVTVPAKGYATIDWPSGGGLDFGDESDAELGLYKGVTSFEFNDESKLIDYICWGSHSGGRKDVAETGGAWTGPCASAFAVGSALHRELNTPGNSAGNYEAGTPSAQNCSP